MHFQKCLKLCWQNEMLAVFRENVIWFSWEYVILGNDENVNTGRSKPLFGDRDGFRNYPCNHNREQKERERESLCVFKANEIPSHAKPKSPGILDMSGVRLENILQSWQWKTEKHYQGIALCWDQGQSEKERKIGNKSKGDAKVDWRSRDPCSGDGPNFWKHGGLIKLQDQKHIYHFSSVSEVCWNE